MSAEPMTPAEEIARWHDAQAEHHIGMAERCRCEYCTLQDVGRLDDADAHDRRAAEHHRLARLARSLDTAATARTKLAELAALPENWDSHGGCPINRDVLSLLELLLTVPAKPVPSSTGAVQLEWHGQKWDVEITFLGGGDGGVELWDWYIGRVDGPEHSG